MNKRNLTHSADTEFRMKMSEFYPDICEFKK